MDPTEASHLTPTGMSDEEVMTLGKKKPVAHLRSCAVGMSILMKTVGRQSGEEERKFTICNQLTPQKKGCTEREPLVSAFSSLRLFTFFQSFDSFVHPDVPGAVSRY